jgi:putative DNA primase/helicase
MQAAALDLFRRGRARGPCPTCDHASGDRDDALSVSEATERPGGVTFRCHRCEESGWAPLVNGATHRAVATGAAPFVVDFAARWAAARPAPEDHPYLTRKRIKAHGLRVDTYDNALLVPMLVGGGVLVGMQRIGVDGAKRYLSGSKPIAAAFVVGKVGRTVCIAEGFATAASIHEATGHACAVAFSRVNLEPLARRIRAALSDAAIIVCADDDRETAGNPGLADATTAAAATNSMLAVPQFADPRPEHATDFNDLAIAEGPVAVRTIIRAAQPVPQAEQPPRADGRPSLFVGRQGVKPCFENALRLVRWMPELRSLSYDTFLERMRYGGADFDDSNYPLVLSMLQREEEHGIMFNMRDAIAAVDTVARERRVNMLRTFVDSLPAWDGTERIELAFTEAWGAPLTDLVRAASRNFFVALIARAIRPGCKVDTMWAFEGAQGLGKSVALDRLAGEIEGEKMHGEITASIGSDNFFRELRSLWVAELAEMDSMRGREASTIKRVLSSPSDRFVEKYERNARRYRRTAVCVATTNEADYWQDPTGSRRLVPIECTNIRLDLITENRLQWFAEALHRFNAHETWWEFPAAEFRAAGESRQVGDPWEDILREKIANGRMSVDSSSLNRVGGPEYSRVYFPADFVSSAEILSDWLELMPSQMPAAGSKRLSGVMKRLGFIPKQSPLGDRARGWVRAVDTNRSEGE